ncbi:hypothetical protein L6164_006707 [Bauhinia variegata]|uniref:Uncharacterized protein n=1 Tax=Bauhinia variegata TaxID=167791 RepID=A0ACB9PXC4_BAUVA|nr:hypothetical protein L6164_006707 [Bauhinia variegata]
MASAESLKMLEFCKISPPSVADFSLPLTFSDLIWMKFHPVERLFFYSFHHLDSDSDSDSSFFFDSVVPKLKHSLSLNLQHFLPLAGNIVWPSNSQKPIFKFIPGDGVSLIIAESDADFHHLSGNSPVEAIKSRPLVPHLDSSDSISSVISLQITLFPNRGFCIGISAHHAALDGKSTIMFMKAWAYICQNGVESPSLLPELQPFLNREVIKDPNGLDVFFVNQWKKLAEKMDPSSVNQQSLKILFSFPPGLEESLRATFELSRSNLEKIKNKVLLMWDNTGNGEESIHSKPPTLSTFVATSSYVIVCIVKALKAIQNNHDKFLFGFTVDCRSRLEPPIPENYFGNCVCPHVAAVQPEEITKENGLISVAKKIYSKVKKLDKGVLDGIDGLFTKWDSLISEGVQAIGVAGSTRFGVYGTDFGWGRPVKVEITSIDRGLTMAFAESRDGNGGIEIGLVMNKHAMNAFANIFHEGLQSL